MLMKIILLQEKLQVNQHKMKLRAFYVNLSKCGTKPVILSIVPGYIKSCEPSLLKSSYPQSLKDLYKKEHVTLNYEKLIDICNNVDIPITFEQIINVEKATHFKLIVINDTILEQGE